MKKEAEVIVKNGEIAYCRLEGKPCFLCSEASATGDYVKCEIKSEFEENNKIK